MKKTSLTSVVTMALALVTGQALQAQSAYFQAVTNLNPIGYWPLNETTQPPSPFSFSLTASNSGSLGALGNGYYGAWYQPSGNTWYLTNNIALTNGIASTGDNALWCKPNGANNGQYVVVPRTIGGVANSNITLTPPFTLEAWVLPNASSSGVYGIVAEGGSTVNYGGPNTNNSFYGGGGTGYAGVVMGQYAGFFLFDCFATNGTSKGNELDSPTGGTGPVIGKWNHLVCTYDGTTETMYINNVNVGHKTTPANNAGVTFAPDLTTPLLIGTGPDLTAQSGEGGVNMNGCIDEVAIYKELLPTGSIANHYNAANTTNYPNVVLSDNPVLYYRFNDSQVATNGGYASSTFPVATNYGSLGTSANGVYQPGTTPGAAGPSYAGFGSAPAVALNGWLGAVDVGGGNIPAALNPVGKVPFTVVTWFQGNPADSPARYQDIVGHGNNSYRLALGQTCGETRFNPYNTELQFVSPTDMITNHAAQNDGNWHMAAGVTDGTNAFMYLDGILFKSTNSVTGISIAGSSIDLLLGGAPDSTAANYNTANTDRTFDGQLAQVAMWNTNLSTAQIQSLFNAAGVPPTIPGQLVGVTNDEGASITVAAPVRGSQPITYQWYNNGQAIAGQTNENLSYTSAPTNATGSNYLVATSPYGSVTSSVAQVMIYGSPIITSQSQTSLQVYAGVNPVLSVSAFGAPPIIYQWYSNGVLIASATNSTYTVANAQTTATYTCALSNYVGGPIMTSPITLTVVPDPSAPYPATVLAANPLAFWRLDESGGTTAYDYVGGNNGTYTNTALDFASPYHPNSDPAEGNAPGFGIETTNNSYVGWVPTNINFAAPTNVNGEFSVECWLQEYLVYDDNGIVSLGYGNGGEEFALDCGGNDPAHDLRFYVRDAGGTSEGAVSTFSPFTDGAWHHVVGVCDEANGHVYIYIDGTNAGTGNIPAKSGVLSSSQSLTIGARQEAFGSQLDNQFIGAIDEVALYNYALTPADVQAHFLSAGIAPVITTVTPSSQTVNSGSSATFTPTVIGTAPLTYDWYDANNNLVSTNSVLVISNAQQNSQGNYTLQVNNGYGSASTTVYLSVNLGPPQLVQDLTPLSQTVTLYSGLDTVSYSIVVAGTAPFAYQWYMDGTKVSGATNSTYTFTAVGGTNSYYVTVTNANTGTGAPLTSSTATVIGLAAPQLNPANYAYRVKISFPGYTANPLTNFPALVTLSPSTISGLNFSQFQPNGTDLRFTDATGTSMLPYEIDQWNDGGVSTIWVQIPVLNGTNIWAYWGNPANYDVPPASTNVWLDANYDIVYHLKETNFPFADSTGQYPATNGVLPTTAPGVVGNGMEFNGTSDYITPGLVTLSNQFTAYAWIDINTNASNEQSIWVNQVGGYGSNGFSWYVDTYEKSDRITHFDSGTGTGGSYVGADPTGSTAVPSGWHFMVSTWDQVAGRVTNYIDGAYNGAGTAVVGFGLTNQLNLGAFLNPTLFFDGIMDEARIQGGVASTNWITTTYLNMSDSSFVSYSSVNLEPMLSIINATNGYILWWPTNDGAFTLETATSVSHSAAWTPVISSSAVITNGVWEQFVQPAAGNHYYRLQGQ